MGNRHGHFAHGVVAREVFELLLAQAPRLFGAHLFGDVTKQQQVADQVVLDLDKPTGRLMPAPCSITTLHVVMHAERRVFRGFAGQLLQQSLA
ncbi:hypothetical protein D3C73_1373800 [compost metagenome]